MAFPNVVPMKYAEGQKLLYDRRIRQELLIRIYTKQRALGYCGVHAAALLMSSRHFGETCCPTLAEQADCDVSNPPYSDLNLFTFPQTSQVLDEERLVKVGATLAQIQDLLKAFDLPVTRVHADKSNVDEFRRLVTAALSAADSSRGVIINYEYDYVVDGKIIKVGHYSPLGAFDETSDRLLMMDVWLDGEPIWMTTQDIFRRMDTADPDSGLSRGFLVMG